MTTTDTTVYNSNATEWTSTADQSALTPMSSDFTSNSTGTNQTVATSFSSSQAVTPAPLPRDMDNGTLSTALTTTLSSSAGTTPIFGDKAPTSRALDRNAIIAGAAVGLLLIAILMVGVCLAKARRRRAGDGARRAKAPRPTPAGASVMAREPNPYTNACFDATKEEMGERARQTEEPAKSAAEAINSVRNKEDHWIVPLEELAEDDTIANFDTTKF